jgi:hypothetical protein
MKQRCHHNESGKQAKPGKDIEVDGCSTTGLPGSVGDFGLREFTPIAQVRQCADGRGQQCPPSERPIRRCDQGATVETCSEAWSKLPRRQRAGLRKRSVAILRCRSEANVVGR